MQRNNSFAPPRGNTAGDETAGGGGTGRSSSNSVNSRDSEGSMMRASGPSLRRGVAVHGMYMYVFCIGIFV